MESMNASMVILQQARLQELYNLWNDSLLDWPHEGSPSSSGSLSPSSISSLTLPDWQRWMVVSGLMPIILGLYLAVIMMCYYLLCRKDGRQWWATDIETGSGSSMSGSSTTMTVASPPPSYAIFVRSGDSQLRPPPYKALFPGAIINASFDSVDFDQLPQVFGDSTTAAKPPAVAASKTMTTTTTATATATATATTTTTTMDVGLSVGVGDLRNDEINGQPEVAAGLNSGRSFLRLGSQDTLVSKEELASHEESDLFKRMLRRGTSF